MDDEDATPVAEDIEWAEIFPDQLNANLGTERGEYALEESFDRYGAGRGGLLDGNNNTIAGNKASAVAMRKGLKAKVVDISPDEYLFARRRDLDLYDETDPTARDLATADNRVAQLNLEFDNEMLMLAEERYGAQARDTFWVPEERADMELAQERKEEDEAPMDLGTIRKGRRQVVIVYCDDENQVADLTEWCDGHDLKWKMP